MAKLFIEKVNWMRKYVEHHGTKFPQHQKALEKALATATEDDGSDDPRKFEKILLGLERSQVFAPNSLLCMVGTVLVSSIICQNEARLMWMLDE